MLLACQANAIRLIREAFRNSTLVACQAMIHVTCYILILIYYFCSNVRRWRVVSYARRMLSLGPRYLEHGYVSGIDDIICIKCFYSEFICDAVIFGFVRVIQSWTRVVPYS